MKNFYTVAICMITYNHELFIAEAIESILNQKTKFSFHLFIGEDCSSDKTRDICVHYKNKYPEKITLLAEISNLGMSKNFIRTLEFCSAKYIAICEGDDYWIDPYKLQKQVDFMEINPDYSMVYHRVKIFDETEKIFRPEENNLSDKEITYTIEDLAVKNFIHTPSVLFRVSALDYTLLNENRDVFMDYFLWMICAKSGKIKYIPDIMAVYRVWDGSVWELKNIKIKMYIWLPLLISLLNIFLDNKPVYFLLFNQLSSSYRRLYIDYSAQENKEKLDLITKKILLEVDGFQVWWFSYMIHLKKSRTYRFKYFFYLVRKRSLVSYLLLKKCIY